MFFGRLADLYGRKRAFICGILCQAAFSLGCGFAQGWHAFQIIARALSTHNVITDPLTLAVLRGFQGIGSAAIIPSAVSSPQMFLMDSYSLTFSARYSSARVSTVKSTFNSIRYLCSGCSCRWRIWHAHGRCPDSTNLVRHDCRYMLYVLHLTMSPRTHWRSIFYTAAATSALTAVSGLISFDADVPSEELVKRIDWIGASLITIGLILIIFVLGQGEIASDGWKTPCKHLVMPRRSWAKIVDRYHCLPYHRGYHGCAIPGLGVEAGTNPRRESIKSDIYVDTATAYEPLALD